MGSQSRTIGILGRRDLSDEEAADLFYLGQLIATLGCELIYIPTPGTSDQVREGVEAADGETRRLDRGVIQHAGHTLVYPDPTLLTRLLAAYPDLEDNDKVTIIEEGCVPAWNKALTKLIEERGDIAPPR
jgi:hypothetical protein